jgi:hypothetical protein
MSALSKAAPIAVQLGLVHVSVGPVSSGHCAFAWSSATRGPVPICGVCDYERAVDHARAYVAVDPAGRVLDLPDGLGDVEGRGLVHVELRDNNKLEVLHESSSGNSFATLRLYDAKDRKRALLFAVEVLPQYGNPRGASRLGRVSA